jgi:hypothetical protein
VCKSIFFFLIFSLFLDHFPHLEGPWNAPS